MTTRHDGERGSELTPDLQAVLRLARAVRRDGDPYRLGDGGPTNEEFAAGDRRLRASLLARIRRHHSLFVPAFGERVCLRADATARESGVRTSIAARFTLDDEASRLVTYFRIDPVERRARTTPLCFDLGDPLGPPHDLVSTVELATIAVLVDPFGTARVRITTVREFMGLGFGGVLNRAS